MVFVFFNEFIFCFSTFTDNVLNLVLSLFYYLHILDGSGDNGVTMKELEIHFTRHLFHFVRCCRGFFPPVD